MTLLTANINNNGKIVPVTIFSLFSRARFPVHVILSALALLSVWAGGALGASAPFIFWALALWCFVLVITNKGERLFVPEDVGAWFVYLLVSLPAAFILYAQTLRMPILSDNYIYFWKAINYPLVDQLRWVDSACRFRPARMLFWSALLGLSGGNFVIMRLLHILVHGLCGALVGGLAAVLVGDRRAGWMASAAFVLYPAHPDSVCWFAEEIWWGFMGLGCLYLAARYMTAGGAWRLLGSVFLGWMALLTKEAAVGLLPAAVAMSLLGFGGRASHRRAAIIAAGLTGVIMLYFIQRAAALGSASGIATIPGSGVGVAAWAKWLSSRYLIRLPGLLWTPLNEDVFVHHRFIMKIAGSFAVAVIFAVPFLSGVNWRVVLLGALIAGFFAAPAFPFFDIPPNLEASRYLYAPVIGVVLILSHLLTLVKNSKRRYALAATWILLWFAIAWQNIAPWIEAGRMARDVIAQIVQIAPNLKRGSRITVLDLPDNYKGAYVWRNGLAEALSLKYQLPPIVEGRSKIFPIQVYKKEIGPERVDLLLRWNAADGKMLDFTSVLRERLELRKKLVGEAGVNLPPLVLKGWPPFLNPFNDLAAVSGGPGVYRVTGPHPWFRSSRLGINPLLVKAIEARMKIRPLGMTHYADLYWRTRGDFQYRENKKVSFELIPDGQTHVYSLPVADYAEWILSDTVMELRFDPTDGPAIVEVEDIVIIPVRER